MTKSLKPIDVIDLLGTQEYKIALLYKEFSERFPIYKDMWSELVKDELEHQRLILSFKKYLDEGKIFFNGMMLRVENIKEHIQFIEDVIDKTLTEGLTLKEAVKTALEIEGSMIDQDFFIFFTGDAKILNAGLQTLTNETNKHYNTLRDAAERLKIN
jgi:hypothetical protein